jgi:hypothetical protein
MLIYEPIQYSKDGIKNIYKNKGVITMRDLQNDLVDLLPLTMDQ